MQCHWRPQLISEWALELKWLIRVILSWRKGAEPSYTMPDRHWVCDALGMGHDLGLGGSLQLRQITKCDSAEGCQLSNSQQLGEWVLHDLKRIQGASLMAQWLRIRLPMQGTRVQALIREDPTCRRATKPVRHNYRACALEPASHNYWAHVPQLLKPPHLEPVLPTREATAMRSLRTTTKSSPRSLQPEKSPHAATKTQRDQK